VKKMILVILLFSFNAIALDQNNAFEPGFSEYHLGYRYDGVSTLMGEVGYGASSWVNLYAFGNVSRGQATNGYRYGFGNLLNFNADRFDFDLMAGIYSQYYSGFSKSIWNLFSELEASYLALDWSPYARVRVDVSIGRQSTALLFTAGVSWFAFASGEVLFEVQKQIKGSGLFTAMAGVNYLVFPALEVQAALGWGSVWPSSGVVATLDLEYTLF